MRAALVAAALAPVAAIARSRPPRLAADLVITRAGIWTGNSAPPSAMAVAVIDDRIDVGGADEIEHWRGPNTTVLNAEGRRLIPGFNDARLRLADGGTRLGRGRPWPTPPRRRSAASGRGSGRSP